MTGLISLADMNSPNEIYLHIYNNNTQTARTAPRPKYQPKVTTIQIHISRLILIQMSARSLPKHCGFFALSVSVCHFTKFSKNRQVSVWEMVKSLTLQWWREWKSDQESTYGSVDQRQNLVTSRVTHCPSLLYLVDVLLTERMTEW